MKLLTTSSLIVLTQLISHVTSQPHVDPLHLIDLVHGLDTGESDFFDVGRDGVLRGFTKDLEVKKAARLNSAQIHEFLAMPQYNLTESYFVSNSSDVSEDQLLHPKPEILADALELRDSEVERPLDVRAASLSCGLRQCTISTSCRAVNCVTCFKKFCF